MEENKNEKSNVLRVSSRTRVKDLAGAITATMKDYGFVELRAIGDGAIGRAYRAYIISKGQMAMANIKLITDGGFFLTEIDGNERTGVKILIEDR